MTSPDRSSSEEDRLRVLLRRAYGALLTLGGHDTSIVEDLHKEFGGGVFAAPKSREQA